MIEHRFQIEARLESGVSERRVDGGSLQLLTVCLCDEGAGEVSYLDGEPLSRPLVVSYLRPGEARDLAFCLLELAELAERRTEAGDELA
jgi:hypothetical protein